MMSPYLDARVKTSVLPHAGCGTFWRRTPNATGPQSSFFSFLLLPSFANSSAAPLRSPCMEDLRSATMVLFLGSTALPCDALRQIESPMVVHQTDLLPRDPRTILATVHAELHVEPLEVANIFRQSCCYPCGTDLALLLALQGLLIISPPILG